jgi:hypothetical protein
VGRYRWRNGIAALSTVCVRKATTIAEGQQQVMRMSVMRMLHSTIRHN